MCCKTKCENNKKEEDSSHSPIQVEELEDESNGSKNTGLCNEEMEKQKLKRESERE